MPTSLTSQVKENLLFYSLWTQVTEIPLSNGDVLIQGLPKDPLLNDDEQQYEQRKKEIVLPIGIADELTPRRLESIFTGLQDVLGQRPKRIIAGIVNDDSTVVYYFIHDGVSKPKRN